MIFLSFTLNIVEHELEPFGHIVRTLADNPTLGEVRHYLNAATGDGPATLYVCDDEADVMAAYQAGCYAVYVNPEASEPAPGAVLSVLEGEDASIVFDALLDVARSYGDWEREMDMLRLTGGSLQDLVTVSEPFLRNNVVVLDPALKLIAYTKGVPCDDPVTMELIEHGYHTEDNIRKFKLHKRFKSWSEDEGFVINETRAICKYTTIVKSFKTRSSFSVIAVMMCNVSDELTYLVDVFRMFTERVEFYANRDYPDDKPAGNAVDTFLKDLLAGAMNEQAVVARSQYVGIPHSGTFCLFYLEAGEDSVPSPRLLSDVSLVVAPAKTMLVDNAVVVLCFNCAQSRRSAAMAPTTCPRAHKSNSERLDKLLERNGLTCGRSTKFKSLLQMPTALGQARAAYDVSCRLDADGPDAVSNEWPRIFPFDRYAGDYLVGQLPPETVDLLGASYASSVLNAIAKNDEEAHTNNYAFLRTYLANERRTSTVAEKLHMHRNNVNYRINRIEEQFGIDTDDPVVRQGLLSAYQLRDSLLRMNR